jgi:hypothetical protein
MEDRISNFEQAIGTTLPADYRRFLGKHPEGAALTDGQLRYSLAAPEVLAAPFPFDHPRIDRPLHRAHAIYLGRFRDAGMLVFDGGSEPVKPESFDRMVTVGFAERPGALDEGRPPTQVVVLDPADGSVRLVPIDPPAVARRVADTFGKWFRQMARKPAPEGTTKAPTAAAKKKAPKRPTRATVLAALKRKQRLTLPPAYEKFLKSKDAPRHVVSRDGRSWALATPEELGETGHGLSDAAGPKPLPFVRCTRFFADHVRTSKNARAVPIVGEAKKKFTLARLRKGVCVGVCNGDPLFLDPTDDFSAWTYSQENSTVEKLAGSFAAFAKPKPVAKSPRRPVARRAAA